MADGQPQRVPRESIPLYPFVGIPSFLRVPVVVRLDEGAADMAVLGVPTDEGQPFIPGARFGPRAIREQTLRFTSTGTDWFDLGTGESLLEHELRSGRLVDLGDVPIVPTDVEATFEGITSAVAGILRCRALPIVLGGDHSITYPIVRAFEQPLIVVQLDAHLDYAAAQGGFRHTNAHAFRHISGFDNVERLVQVGIRGLRTSREAYEATIADGNVVIGPERVREEGVSAVLQHIPADAPCYLTLDVDVLDGALVPGCVSAEPDGLTYAQVRDTLRAVAQRADIIGVDLVEVNPLVDVPSGATAYIAANLLIQLLGAVAAQPRWVERKRG